MSKPEITPAMLAEIKSKAEKTPPGAIWHKEERINFVRNSAGWRIAIAECKEDAEHIASADPATVLAMVDEIEQLRSELAKRPIVYCYRNKHGDLAKHFGSGSLALWAAPEDQKPTNPDLDWQIEVYTGSSSHDRTQR